MPSRLFSVFLLLLAMVPPVPGQTAHSSDRDSAKRGIAAGNAAYIEAFKRGNARALSQVYDPQGSRLNDSGLVVRGRKEIAEDVGKFIEQVGPVQVTLDSKEFWLIDDQAYETGLWSYTFTPKGKAEQHIGGDYVTVWKKQPGGGWKIWADMGVPGT
jgi:uncharacterized protein (TIGR02246 family)